MFIISTNMQHTQTNTHTTKHTHIPNNHTLSIALTSRLQGHFCLSLTFTSRHDFRHVSVAISTSGSYSMPGPAYHRLVPRSSYRGISVNISYRNYISDDLLRHKCCQKRSRTRTMAWATEHACTQVIAPIPRSKHISNQNMLNQVTSPLETELAECPFLRKS